MFFFFSKVTAKKCPTKRNKVFLNVQNANPELMSSELSMEDLGLYWQNRPSKAWSNWEAAVSQKIWSIFTVNHVMLTFKFSLIGLLYLSWHNFNYFNDHQTILLVHLTYCCTVDIQILPFVVVYIPCHCFIWWLIRPMQWLYSTDYDWV